MTDKKADMLVIDMPLLDTRVKGKDVTGTLIADLVLQIMTYVAETKMTFIRQRQKERIVSTRNRGVRLGRSKFLKKREITGKSCLFGKNDISQGSGRSEIIR